jgi:excisionase family DNA binding protein
VFSILCLQILNVKTAPEFYTVGEAARILRVSRGTVYQAVERGTLPSLRLAEQDAIRIPVSAIRERVLNRGAIELI